MEYLTLFFAGVVGLVLGSFYNVCIHRFISNESIVFPRSHCPDCNHLISWWQNIPLFSYILLKGKCYNCKEKISIRYPFVEAVSGTVSLLLALKFGVGFIWGAYMILFGIMIVSSFIDWETFILPDTLMFSGIALSIIASWLILPIHILDSFLGMLIGGGLFFVVQKTYKAIRKREGLGTGDIKLLGFIGAFVGWYSLPLVLFVSSLTPLVLTLFIKSAKKNQRFIDIKMPYGPFLSLGAFFSVMVI